MMHSPGSHQSNFFDGDDDLYYDYNFGAPLKSQSQIKKLEDDASSRADSFEDIIEGIGETQRAKNYKDKHGNIDIDPYASYEETGVWRGYGAIFKPALSIRYIRYIRQMAVALSAEHKVKVSAGDNWCVDLDKKVLYYDPYSLVYNTRGALIATILHEVGHILHTVPGSNMNGGYLSDKETREGAFMILNVFEDFRIDDIMSQSYPSAKEVYEQNLPQIKLIALRYNEQGKSLTESRAKILESIRETLKGLGANAEKARELVIGERDETKANEVLDDMEAKNKEENLYDYVKLMLLTGYNRPVKAHTQKMQDYIDKTVCAVEECKNHTSTHQVHDTLEKKVYPIIDELLRAHNDMDNNMKGGGKAIKDKNLLDEIRKSIRGVMEGRGSGSSSSSQKPGEQEARVKGENGGSNRGRETIDPAWQQGDYDVLKASVKDMIDEVKRKLVLVKRADQTTRWETDHRRGRINTKSLHRFSTGNTRLFKKKEMKEDRVTSHAFSLMLDVSGSMQGSRMAHSVRAIITMMESLKEYGVPFEVITFDSQGRMVKEFTQEVDKKIQSHMAGLVNYNGGSTNLHAALELSKLPERPEKLKTLIMVTDGGVGSQNYYDQYMERFTNAKVHRIGIAIEADSDMKALCDEWKELRDVQEFPEAIIDILNRIGK